MKVSFYNGALLNRWSEDDGLLLASRLVKCHSPVDRTGHSNNFNIKYDSIPTDMSKVLSWKECCIKSAEELWKLGKPITLFWSGGIDSTTAFLALRETKTNDNDLVVRYTHDSVTEYPNFLKDIIPFGSQLEPENLLINWDKNVNYVNGECGDQCFGSDILEKYMDHINEPWQNILEWDNIFVIPRNLTQETTPKMLINLANFLEQHISYCPIQVKTIFDLYWWINFSIKWNFVDQRMIHYLAMEPYRENVHSFFNTQDFQKWSLANHNNKHDNTWRTYKQPSKDLIFEYTGDEEYRKNKVKEVSLQRVFKYYLTDVVGKTSSDMRVIRASHENKNTLKLILDDGQFWRRDDKIPKYIIDKVLKNKEMYRIL
jgi:hypothetical protein